MAKRILVAIKRVVDYNARIRVKPDKVFSALESEQHCSLS